MGGTLEIGTGTYTDGSHTRSTHTKDTHARQQCQKGPTTVSKETYYSVKSDLLMSQAVHTRKTHTTGTHGRHMSDTPFDPSAENYQYLFRV